MPSFDRIASQLAELFANSYDKKSAAIEIVNIVNNLVYTGTERRLTLEHKEYIVRKIFEYIPLQKSYSGENWTELITEKRDNAQYLDMVNFMINQLNPKK